MVKIFFCMVLISLSLYSRENPFFPSSEDADIYMSSNQELTIEPLKQASFTLPSTARTIQSITVEYKNLDGSLVKKTMILQNSIDWHLPLFLSQSYKNSLEPAVQKKLEKFKNISSLKFIKIYERKKELKLVTKDTMIRNFLLTQPHRIVCDFKRDIEMRSYEKNINTDSIVTKIRLGNHSGYYRIVIELDGHYMYKLTKLKGTYLFKFL